VAHMLLEAHNWLCCCCCCHSWCWCCRCRCGGVSIYSRAVSSAGNRLTLRVHL
jgi:hypothetical protein